MAAEKSAPAAPRHVDGPMLPHLNHFTASSSDDGGLPRATTSLVPILTPPIITAATDGGRDGDDGSAQQYLLVPSPSRIVLRSAQHGKRMCDLAVPARDGGDDAISAIRAVALAWLPHRQEKGDADEDEDDDGDESADGGSDDGEWIVLAGCNDGVAYEWSLSDVLSSASTGTPSVRRSFRLKCDGIIHLTPLASSDVDTCKHLSQSLGKAVLYGLVTGEDGSTQLVRCEVPPMSREDRSEQSHIVHKTLASVKHVSSKEYREASARSEHVCLKKKDCVFGLLAAYRPARPSKSDHDDRMDYVTDNKAAASSIEGDVFLVMCATQGLAMYRDSLREIGTEGNSGGDGDASTRLVHFTKSMSSVQYYTKDQMTFSSIACSPNANDLALGRANGHIEVLDSVFENVASYLDSAEDGSVQHPEVATVRRTVHWHAHPVRSLAFLTAYGRHSKGGGDSAVAAPMSLLSGGEESVLVTWQLERNFHKPSNFIARVGQGGIVHTLTCRYTGRIVVFCSDNSIQCFDSSNLEREWAEVGLASMALHEDDGSVDDDDGDVQEVGDGGRRRAKRVPARAPIIMIKDPITNYPMLTNLPGAPGWVHWYDAKSASVVGTLEVAPYNRVSRRDAATDPHVPAPAVTHMAVSRDGKDMVTVDAVWTENTSVGASYGLKGPQGSTVPMNVCTSIKFWVYVEPSSSSKGGRPSSEHARRRRNGDVPMNYELVSSMAAPHGREGEVCALDVAPSGSVACTLSQEEDAFRVWAKHAGAGGVGSTMWKCLYKVKTPSGYANLLSQRISLPSLGQKLVTFSSDGTVLCVSYGPHVTLWDHSSATLLTSVSLGDKAAFDREDVSTVNFLTKNDDTILLTSTSQVGVRSPFGGVKSCYLGEDEWSFDASLFGQGAIVSAAVPLHDYKTDASGGFFAVSFSSDKRSKSVVSIINRDEGSLVCVEGTETPIQWHVDSEVQSLAVEMCEGSSVQLLAITKDGQMLSLSCEPEKHVAPKRRAASFTETQARNARAQAPVLKLGAGAAGDAQEPIVKKRKVSIGIAKRSGVSGDLSGFEFPALSGRFTSAFIAHSLGKRGN